jgi:hypothetical protein
MVQGKPGPKGNMTPTQQTSMVGHTCNSNQEGDVGKRIESNTSLGKKCQTLPEK